MNKSLLPVFLLVTNTALAGPQVTYVGDGRNVCSGTQAECAPYERDNREREKARERSQAQRESIEEQRKQTRLLEEISRQDRRKSGY